MKLSRGCFCESCLFQKFSFVWRGLWKNIDSGTASRHFTRGDYVWWRRLGAQHTKPGKSEVFHYEQGERCKRSMKRRTRVARHPREKGVVKHGWKIGTIVSNAEEVADRWMKRGVRAPTREIDAVVLYWMETSVTRDGKRLSELTVRCMWVAGRYHVWSVTAKRFFVKGMLRWWRWAWSKNGLEESAGRRFCRFQAAR